MGAGKLAILHCFIKADSSGTLTPPAGWTQRGTTKVQGSDSSAVYSRELDGSETAGGTITVTSAGSAGRRAAWINTVNVSGGTGWNFENIDEESSAASTTISDNNVTTGGNARLAMNFIGYATRQTGGQENFAGETGGSWVASAFYESGSNPTLSLQTAELASTGTISGGSDTSIVSSAWIIHGFSVWRNSSVLPDLTVTDILQSAAQAAVGEPLVLSAVVFNAGAGSTPAVQHGVRFDVTGAAVAFSTSHVTSLSASTTITLAADGSWTPTTAGSLTAVATVNYGGQITESSTANNTFTKILTVINRPDLNITTIAWTPAAPEVGNSVNFTVVLNNAGLGISPGSVTHEVSIEVAGSIVASSKSYLGSLAAAGNITLTADGFWQPPTSGEFQVTATIDPSNAIPETNNDNNTKVNTITVNVASGAAVLSFAGRVGHVVPIINDYNGFFLTEGEANDLYVRLDSLVNQLSAYATVEFANATFITSASAQTLFITQTEANAQGMPAIESTEYNGGATPPSAVTHGTGNITLRTPSNPSDYWQSRENTGGGAITVSMPAGHTLASGSAIINAGQSGLFIKGPGATFRRRG
jgi:hypothetical protein